MHMMSVAYISFWISGKKDLSSKNTAWCNDWKIFRIPCIFVPDWQSQDLVTVVVSEIQRTNKQTGLVSSTRFASQVTGSSIVNIEQGECISNTVSIPSNDCKAAYLPEIFGFSRILTVNSKFSKNKIFFTIAIQSL